MDLHLIVNVGDFVLCGYSGNNKVVNEFYLFDFEECIEICACMHNLYAGIKFLDHFVVNCRTAQD